MPQPASFQRRRISLQLKLVAGLIAIVLAPLLVSAYLIDELSRVAANFAASEAAERQAPMERALATYRELFAVTKQLQGEVARRLAARPELAGAAASESIPAILEQEPGVVRITVLSPTGALTAEGARPLPGVDWRAKEARSELPGGGELVVEFAVPATLQDDYQALNRAIASARSVARVRTALPAGYRTAFLALSGITVLVAIIIGIVAARRVTHRVGVLVATAQEVSAGKHDARAELSGRDEMAELAVAFNTMLDEVDAKRRQIEYLQRIGAWQDVARRIAHEIKNPLTPIQLAVQQCVSAYRGDDERFARTLADTREIVEEEIAGLRRLVDTFRTLGQLPRVEATPIALATVIEDLRHDPVAAPHLTLRPPDTAVTVRADKLLLKRVLANLVENGMHAGREAGAAGDVVVSWRTDGAVAQITVDDQGRGVADVDRERIFEPYVTTKETGTGLGLAIAKKIALEHGGDLAIAADLAPTGGARFVVTMPLA
jgi:two-component system, NtrC family, nitrogen regulation sensor histidine kinase NtrY